MTRLLLTLGFCLQFFLVYANSDIFQSYAIINSGSGDTYLAGGANADGAATFTSAAFGTPSTLILNGGEIKSYENSGHDVFAAEINYRVFKQGDTPGAFTTIALNDFEFLPNGGDEKRSNTTAGVDLLSLATAGNGTYVIEIFWKASANPSDHFDSNGGFNYTNTFVVNVLPVSYSSLAANVYHNKVTLNWTTAQEVNNDYFIVERSGNNQNWYEIGRVEGSGTKDSESFYSFIDEKPFASINYYRLKQVDLDGEFAYSNTMKAHIDRANALVVYPNPTSNYLTFENNGSILEKKIQLFDSQGKLLNTYNFIDQTNISVAHLDTGIFFFRVLDDNGQIVEEGKLSKL